jgi:hypothetical protein
MMDGKKALFWMLVISRAFLIGMLALVVVHRTARDAGPVLRQRSTAEPTNECPLLVRSGHCRRARKSRQIQGAASASLGSRDIIPKTGYFDLLRVASSKQAQPPSSPLYGRGGTGRTLPAEFVAHQFKKGQSGNPTGNKGSTYGEVVQIAREYSEKAVRRLIELVDSDDERVAFMASQALLDRAYGKPRDHAELSPIEAPKNEERRRKVVARLVADLNAMAAAMHAGVEQPAGCVAVPVLASPKRA